MEYGLLLCAVALSKVFAYKCIEGRKLTEIAGGPDVPFRMETEKLTRLLGGNLKIARQLKEPSLLEWAEAELEWCGEYGIRALYIDDEEYPARLRECCDAPLVLYCKGGISLNPERTLAVVGTRKASYTGRSACISAVRDISSLIPPPVIVSGLAFGIDATAHQAALDSGIKTIAVIPSASTPSTPPRTATSPSESPAKGRSLPISRAAPIRRRPISYGGTASSRECPTPPLWPNPMRKEAA